MTCVDARRALLVAEPDELRGIGESEVARHVRTCAECSAAAQKILGTTAMLSVQLDRVAAPAKKPAVGSAWPVWVALPLAAVIASVLVVRDANTRAPLPRVGELHQLKQPVVRPVVNAPANRNVAVIEAAGITVVWDLGAKGGS